MAIINASRCIFNAKQSARKNIGYHSRSSFFSAPSINARQHLHPRFQPSGRERTTMLTRSVLHEEKCGAYKKIPKPGDDLPHRRPRIRSRTHVSYVQYIYTREFLRKGERETGSCPPSARLIIQESVFRELHCPHCAIFYRVRRQAAVLASLLIKKLKKGSIGPSQRTIKQTNRRSRSAASHCRV